MKAYALALALLAAAVGVQVHQGTAPRPTMAPDSLDSVPEAVRTAAEQGRFWRASRLLEEHLSDAADTTPATILFAARLSAGWEDWATARSLLEDRPWLDTVEAGAGWELLGRARIARGDLEAGADALATYLEVGGRAPEAWGVAELRRGLALGRTDRPATALDAFDAAARRLSWLADWAHYFAAEAAARAGDPAEVERRLARAGTAGTGRWRLRVAAMLVAGDTLAAREAALAATREEGRAERAEAWAELGRLRLAMGDSARGRAALFQAMRVRGSLGAVDAARRLSAFQLEPEEWRAVAEVYRWHGNASRAVAGYEAYLGAEAGTAAERAQVRLELGRARFDAGRFRQAERTLLALAADSVPPRIAAEALYTAARAQYRQGRSGDGQATFLRLAERFPGQDAVSRGLYLAADLKHDDLELDGPDGARIYYRRAADAAPDVNEAGLALMRLAGLEYLDGHYEGAAGVWEEYRTRHPEGRRIAQATYWAARSYERLGRDSLATARLEQVRAADPLSYYGVRAAEQLGRSVLDFPMAGAPPRDPAADAWVRQGMRRVDVLSSLDRREALVHEVERLRREAQAGSAPNPLAAQYGLAEALNERGYTLTGIGMGWDLREEDEPWNPRLLRIVYPFPFRTLVVAEAVERGVDPYMVAGLIRRESAFSPVVVSGAGAIGLMQVVPGTGRSLARGTGLGSFEAGLLYRPEVNVHLGTRFFAELHDRFDASLPMVLAAYNAGPTRARRWQEMPEAGDPELFTERIPYRETRNYIRNVLAHHAIYRELYPGVDDDR